MSSMYALDSKRQQDINEAILDFLLLEELPLSHADSETWYRLLTSLDPRCCVLSGQMLHKALVQYFTTNVST